MLELLRSACACRRFALRVGGAADRRSSMSAVACAAIFDDSGAVLAEYALVLTLLACAFMAGMNLVERAAGQALTNVETGLLNYATRTGT